MVRFILSAIAIMILLSLAIVAYFPELIIQEEELPEGTEDHLVAGFIEEELFEPPPLTITGASVVFSGGDDYYLIGDVAVGVVFVEGPTYNWSWQNKTFVLDKIQHGHDNITATEPRAYLRWFYDVRNATVSVEPRDESHGCSSWTDEAVQDIGYTDTEEYLNHLKTTYSADWAFLILIPYGNRSSSNWYAWTCASSHKFITFYSNYQARPYSMDRITMHETLHIFGARDKYCDPGYFCCTCGGAYGYLGIPNDACEAGCEPGYEDGCTGCVDTTGIMASLFDYPQICENTRHQIGWLDSDEDDVLDPVDSGQVITVTSSTPSHSAASVGSPVSWTVSINITGGNGTAIYTFPDDYISNSVHLYDRNLDEVSPFSSGQAWVSWYFYENLSNYTLTYDTSAPTITEQGFVQDKVLVSNLDEQYIIQTSILSNPTSENYTSVSWIITCPTGFVCNQTSSSSDIDSGDQVYIYTSASGDRLSETSWNWQASASNLSFQQLSGTSDVTNLAPISFDDVVWSTSVPDGFSCDICIGIFDIAASSQQTLTSFASADVLAEAWGDIEGEACTAGGDCFISRDLNVNNTSSYSFNASINIPGESGWICAGNGLEMISPGENYLDDLMNCSKTDVITKVEWPWKQDLNFESNISEQYVFRIVNGTNTENIEFFDVQISLSCDPGFECNESSTSMTVRRLDPWTRTIAAKVDVIDVAEAHSVVSDLSFTNFTVNNTGDMEFENLTVWLDLNETDIIDGTEYLYYWDDGWVDITPITDCNSGFELVNSFYACREDMNENGISDRFTFIQPHTSSHIYQLGGQIPVPKAGLGQSCSIDPDCESDNCCHNICRSSCPYCGDGFCDDGESCGSDCPVPPPPSPPPVSENYKRLDLQTPYSVEVTSGNVISFTCSLENTGTLDLSDIELSAKGYSVDITPSSISSISVGESTNISVQLAGIPGDFLLGITASTDGINDTELVYIHIYSPEGSYTELPIPTEPNQTSGGAQTSVEISGRDISLVVKDQQFSIIVPEEIEIERVEPELAAAADQCSDEFESVTGVSIEKAEDAVNYNFQGFSHRKLPFVTVNITKNCGMIVVDNTSTVFITENVPREMGRVKDYALPAFGIPGMIISFFAQIGGIFG